MREHGIKAPQICGKFPQWIIAVTLLCAGCLATSPASWKGEGALETDIAVCRLKAADEALPYFIVVGPITGSITRATVYEKCMLKRGWTQVD